MEGRPRTQLGTPQPLEEKKQQIRQESRNRECGPLCQVLGQMLPTSWQEMSLLKGRRIIKRDKYTRHHPGCRLGRPGEMCPDPLIPPACREGPLSASSWGYRIHIIYSSLF